MAISRRLVEMHGGTIGVTSSGVEGEGHVLLHVADRGARVRQPTGLPRLPGCKDGLGSLRADSEARELRIAYLEDAGYGVHRFRIEGREALRWPKAWLKKYSCVRRAL